MKRLLMTLGAAALVAGAASSPAGAAKPIHSAKPAAKKASPAVQKATVVIDHGYSPAQVRVKAGRPVQLTFVRKEEGGGCGETVSIPALGIKRTLKAGSKTLVSFTPKKAGALQFTCGMEMYKGQLIVQ